MGIWAQYIKPRVLASRESLNRSEGPLPRRIPKACEGHGETRERCSWAILEVVIVAQPPLCCKGHTL